MADPRTDLTNWAIFRGLPDPLAVADESLQLDPRALDEAFVQTRQACVGIWRGIASLESVRDCLTTGWPRREPLVMVTALIDAGMTAREVLVRQADQVDAAQAILTSCRTAVSDALDSTARALDVLRTDASGVLWMDPRAEPVFQAFLHAAEGQQARVRDCLAGLLDALSADPLAHVTPVGANHPGLSPLQERATHQGLVLAATRGTTMAALHRDLVSTDVHTRATAEGIRRALDGAAGRGEEATLVLYEGAHGDTQARAAIAIGDLASATRAAVTVPGILNTPADMSGALVEAGTLQRQSEWVGDERTAVVAWFGYPIPGSAVSRPLDPRRFGDPLDGLSRLGSLLDMGNDDAAVRGGELLAQDMAVLRTMMPAGAVVTGVGFSMGSTTVSQAAHRAPVFDSLVLMGSPGAGEGVRSVEDYPGLDPSRVWVNSLENDPVTQTSTDVLGLTFASLTHDHDNLESFGMDPAAASFGAQVMDHRSPADDRGLGLGNHVSANYLTGPLLQSVAAVAAGKAAQVPIKRGR